MMVLLTGPEPAMAIVILYSCMTLSRSKGRRRFSIRTDGINDNHRDSALKELYRVLIYCPG